MRGVEGDLAVVAHGDGQVRSGAEGAPVPYLGRVQFSSSVLARERAEDRKEVHCTLCNSTLKMAMLYVVKRSENGG